MYSLYIAIDPHPYHPNPIPVIPTPHPYASPEPIEVLETVPEPDAMSEDVGPQRGPRDEKNVGKMGEKSNFYDESVHGKLWEPMTLVDNSWSYNIRYWQTMKSII